MDPLNHALIAWMIANSFDVDTRTRRFCLLAGVIPDLDGIPILFDEQLFQAVHHTFGHTLLFGVLVSLVLALFLEKKRLGFSVILLGFAAHLGADIIGSNWPVPMFAPFLPAQISVSPYVSDFVIYSVIGPAFLVLGTLAAVLILVRLKRTPMEFFSKRWDGIMVNFLTLPFKERCYLCGKRAFLVCEDCNRTVCMSHVDESTKRILCTPCTDSTGNVNQGADT